MTLGELKAAIRGRTGPGSNPSLVCTFPGYEDWPVKIVVQKASLLLALDEVFDKQRNAEVALALTESGEIVSTADDEDLDGDDEEL